MSERWRDWLFGVGSLVSCFALVAILVPPMGEFPLADDWDYAATAKELALTGHLRLSDWPAMPLVTHVVWGALFVKLFGSSYYTLRLAIITLNVAGCIALFAWCRWFHRTRAESLFVALSVGFSPVVFCMSYTFMTDVTALGLMLVWLALLPPALRSQRLVWFALLGLVGGACYLARQTAAVPLVLFCVALAIECLLGRARLKHLVALLLPFVLLLGLYYFWRERIHGIPYNAVAGVVAPSILLHLKMLVAKVVVCALNFGFYTSPLVFGLLRRDTMRQLWHTTGSRWVLLAATAGWMVLLVVAGDELRAYEGYDLFDFGMGYKGLAGREVFLGPQIEIGSFRISVFRVVTTVLGMVGSTLWCMLLAAVAADGLLAVRRWPSIYDERFIPMLLLAAIAGELALITLVYTAFDRYYIPAIALGAAFLAALPQARVPLRPFWLSAGLLCTFGLFAVACTQEYMARNDALWKAVRRLHAEGVHPQDITAGLEYDGVYHYSPPYGGERRLRRAYLTKLTPTERALETARRLHHLHTATYWVTWHVPPGYELIREEPYESLLRDGSALVNRRIKPLRRQDSSAAKLSN